MNIEENRLQTFNSWPSHAIIDPARIAKAGFFYTNQDLTVECFSCHVLISEWNYGDQVMAKHRILSPHCAFVIDPATSDNIPVNIPSITSSQSSSSYNSNSYSTVEERLATFTNWPKSDIITPEKLARSGFYFLHKGDQTKCVYCSGVVMAWEPGDDPDTEHSKHFPKCSFVLNTIKLRLSKESQNLAQLGIISHQGPKHSEYGTIESRMATFRNWPAELIQTPEVLADAGFYYEGVGDQVRCFHCDGGLRHWDPPDDPWTEHARWFGNCAFVTLVKGAEFVQACSINVNGDSSRNNRPRLPTASPRRVVSDQELQDYLNSDAARKALEIGINIERVKRAIKEKIEQTGQPYLNPYALVEAALALQHDEDDSVTETDDSSHVVGWSNVAQSLIPGVRPHVVDSATRPDSTKPASNNVNQNDVADEKAMKETKGSSLEEENRLLKEARLCKICMDLEVGIVFLPCGHLTTCVNCAANLEVCPLCRSAIKATVRTFLS